MNKKINIDEKNFSIVRKILKENLEGINAKTYVFGSRTRGNNRKFSDVDMAICAEKELPFRVLSRMKNDFEESYIDYFVDIIDLNNVSDKFVKCIEKDLVEFSY